MKCTVGLHFDENSGNCVWPDTAKREGCDEGPSKFLKKQNFTKNLSFLSFLINLQKNLPAALNVPRIYPKWMPMVK